MSHALKDARPLTHPQISRVKSLSFAETSLNFSYWLGDAFPHPPLKEHLWRKESSKYCGSWNVQPALFARVTRSSASWRRNAKRQKSEYFRRLSLSVYLFIVRNASRAFLIESQAHEAFSSTGEIHWSLQVLTEETKCNVSAFFLFLLHCISVFISSLSFCIFTHHVAICI